MNNIKYFGSLSILIFGIIILSLFVTPGGALIKLENSSFQYIIILVGMLLTFFSSMSMTAIKLDSKKVTKNDEIALSTKRDIEADVNKNNLNFRVYKLRTKISPNLESPTSTVQEKEVSSDANTSGNKVEKQIQDEIQKQTGINEVVNRGYA